MHPPSPVFCALDTTDLTKAKSLATALRPFIGGVKLGLEFFTTHGAAGVCDITALGMPVFLDLKFHDIPNTVAQAVKAAVALDVAMLTIHTLGGAAMMKAAAEAASSESVRLGKKRPHILGVTILTSMEEAELPSVGITGSSLEAEVLLLASQAEKSGLDGIVCSAHEIATIRKSCPRLTLVVPGVRPEGAAIGDQKRVMTPQAAMKQGADYLVIGRPITESTDPAKAAADIMLSIKK